MTCHKGESTVLCARSTLLIEGSGISLTDLALSGLDDAGAVGADEPCRRLLPERVLDLDHVLLRDALGDAHHQGDLILLQTRSNNGAGKVFR